MGGVTGLAEKDEDAHFNRARSVSRSKPKRQKLSEDPHRTASVVPRSQSGIKDPDGSKKAKLAELAKTGQEELCSVREGWGERQEDPGKEAKTPVLWEERSALKSKHFKIWWKI